MMLPSFVVSLQVCGPGRLFFHQSTYQVFFCAYRFGCGIADGFFIKTILFQSTESVQFDLNCQLIVGLICQQLSKPVPKVVGPL